MALVWLSPAVTRPATFAISNQRGCLVVKRLFGRVASGNIGTRLMTQDRSYTHVIALLEIAVPCSVRLSNHEAQQNVQVSNARSDRVGEGRRKQRPLFGVALDVAVHTIDVS